MANCCDALCQEDACDSSRRARPAAGRGWTCSCIPVLGSLGWQHWVLALPLKEASAGQQMLQNRNVRFGVRGWFSSSGQCRDTGICLWGSGELTLCAFVRGGQQRSLPVRLELFRTCHGQHLRAGPGVEASR